MKHLQIRFRGQCLTVATLLASLGFTSLASANPGLAATRLLVATGNENPTKMARHKSPMATDYANSILPRWLAKKVHESKTLDDCESLSTWSIENLVQATGKISLTTERSKDGTHSLRLVCPTTGAKAAPQDRYYGTAIVKREAGGADWSDWNRVSFWVYPDMPKTKNISMIVKLYNDGVEKVPDIYTKMGVNYVLVKNRQWNHIVWEIANLPRDKVTSLQFIYQMQGNEPGGATMAQFDIDKLELQKVDADHYEGWDVAAGEIAFSHAGYQTGAAKTALASDLKATSFEVLNSHGKVAFTGKVDSTTGPGGMVQLMDFSNLTKPGTYTLRAGDRATKPFRIGDDVWESSLEKAINFFYAERCGYAIPGVHDLCHADWFMEHNGQSISVNGGWHDAGDLSQNLQNTAESAYAMFVLAERLQKSGENPKLLATLLDEAKWGLAFVQKTSFHDGFRTGFNMMDRWTDGIRGNLDDIPARAQRSPSVDFICASVEAIAARLLKESDPDLAAKALAQAQEDWKFGAEGLVTSGDNANRGGRRFGSLTELCGHRAMAAVELWKCTGDQQFAEKAAQYGRVIVDSQEQRVLPDLHVPITGFFYTGPDKRAQLRYEHLSNEQAPTVALSQLCEAFPDNPDWMKWYTAVTLYSHYFQAKMAEYTQPYGMLCASIFRDDEYLQQPEGPTREAFKEQVLNGIKVGDHTYIRRFPVWFEFRGNFGTSLSQAVGLAEAAHVRGDSDLAALLQQHLEFIIGKNPFAQSTMWGEGYNYAPQYTALSGNIVGSLPVGIQTHRNGDVPYWPTENCHNWKEVWVIPTGRWIWLMNYLSGPARVSGIAKPGDHVTLSLIGSAYRSEVVADKEGKFEAVATAGKYEVQAGDEHRAMTLLPGGRYKVDLTPGQGFDFKVTNILSKNGVATVQLTVRGTGTHKLTLRMQNVKFEDSTKEITLTGQSQTIELRGTIENNRGPWVAVIIPDDRLADRKEATGIDSQLDRP